MAGIKRKSSDSAECSDRKKIKIEYLDSMEKVFSDDCCVRAILEYLPMDDLVNVSMASYILKVHAEMVFRAVHAATIDLEYDAENFAKQQMIFQRFGRLARKVTINMRNADEDEDEDIFNSDGNKLLRTIGRFCGANLQDLKFCGMSIDLQSTFFSATEKNEIKAVLGNIKKLTLHVVCLKTGFLKWAKSLEELFIHSCCHMEKLPETTTLPKLTILTIGACPTWPFIVGYEFIEFLKANPSIEELDYHFAMIGNGHLKAICALPALTNLKLLDFGGNDLSPISKARNLTNLTVRVPQPDNRPQLLKYEKLVPTGCTLSVV